MTIDVCIAKVTALLEGELSNKDVRAISEEIERRAIRAQNLNPTLDQADALLQASEGVTDDVTRATLIERRNRGLNVLAHRRLTNFIETSMAAGLKRSEAIQALTVGISLPVPGSRLSVDAQGGALAEQMIGAMMADLRKANLLEQLTNRTGFLSQDKGVMDLEIAREMRAVSEGLESPTGIPEARTIAEILQNAQERARVLQNRAGGAIGQRWDYIVRQTHDQSMVKQAGFDDWFDFILPLLDDTTFGSADPRVFLKAAHDNIAGGKHFTVSRAPHDIKFTGPSNLAKQISQERVLHFKSAEAWMAYNDQFGRRSLIEAVILNLETSARNTAMMQTFGTNPRAMFDRLISDSPDKIPGAITNQFKEIDGTTRQIDNVTMAHISANIRAVQSMSKLGAATLSSVTDITTAVSELNYQGGNMAEAIADFSREAFAGLADPEARQMADLLGVGVDSIIGDASSRFTMGDDFTGTMANLQRLFYKANLLSQWTDSMKQALGRVMAHRMAQSLEGSFGDLTPRFREVIGLYGIFEPEWKTLQAVDFRAADGRNYLTADRILELDEAQLRPLIGEKIDSIDAEIDARKSKLDTDIAGLEATDPEGEAIKRARNQRRTIEAERTRRHNAAVNRARDELAGKVGTYYLDRANAGVPTPGARERAIFNQGQMKGTPLGEFMRQFATFKMFPTTIMTRVLGRDLGSIRLNARNAGGGLSGTMQALVEGRGDVAALALHVAMTTSMGVVALNLKEIAKGRSPRDPFGEDAGAVWRAAFLQGGGLGIFGDFMFGEANRFGRGFIETFVGPGLGLLGEGAEIIQGLTSGEFDTANALRLAQSNTPFINLFYTRAAFDYLVMYNLMEIVNPGSVRRLERRVQEENNQTFLIDPTDVID